VRTHFIKDIWYCSVQGAFALEDAMLRGAPIEREVELLRQAAGGTGNDELIDVALQSLPEGILKEGTLTQSQLQDEVNLLFCFLSGSSSS
jgi:hypothetical protein